MLTHESLVADILPDGVDGPADVTQDIEKYQQIDDALHRDAQRLNTICVGEMDKWLLVESYEQVVKVEDA